MSGESQKLYDQDIECISVPLVASPNSFGTEVVKGHLYPFHKADTVIDDSAVLVEKCAGLLARYRNCLLPELTCSGETDCSQDSLLILAVSPVPLELEHRCNENNE